MSAAHVKIASRIILHQHLFTPASSKAQPSPQHEREQKQLLQSAAITTTTSKHISRSRSGLRSSSTSLADYSLPRLRTKFGEQAFSHVGPATWNALPNHIRTVADPVTFRKLLKSHYFSVVLTFADI